MSSDENDAADDSEGVDGSTEQNADTANEGSGGPDTNDSDAGRPQADDPQADDQAVDPDPVSDDETPSSGESDRDKGLAAFIAASAAASRAEAQKDESSSLWGDTDGETDEPGFVEVRRSAPGWAISKWVISGAVAAAVIILSFITIPRLFTPNDSESAAGTTTPPVSAAPTTTAAPVVTYPEVVMASGPTHYWRFEMQSAGADSAGGANLEVGSDAAILGSSAYAGGMGSIDCSGTSKSRTLSTLAETPAGDFSIEVWVNTVTSEGGPIVTFGNRKTDPSTRLDRVMYMATNGNVYFGTQAKSREFVVSELPVNNGTWRHLVGTMSTTTGLTLYVDGQPVNTEKDGTSTSDFEGYWKICGDNTSGWVANSGRPAFTGTVDDVAVYPKALTAQEVLAHYETAKGL